MRYLVVVCYLVVGCTLFPESPETPDASNRDAYRCGWPPTDFLFVVENSALIAPYENTVEENFRTGFINVLSTVQGGFPKDTRFGVVTSDVECEGAGTYSELRWRGIESFVDRPDAQFGERFAQLALAGHDGCGVNRPLETARRAVLDPRFRRSDARLSITLISANTDQSAIDPSTFGRDVTSASTDPTQVGLSVIAHGDARREAVLATLPNRTAFTPIDQRNWTDAMTLWACLL